jgi:hypothetical protein
LTGNISVHERQLCGLNHQHLVSRWRRGAESNRLACQKDAEERRLYFQVRVSCRFIRVANPVHLAELKTWYVDILNHGPYLTRSQLQILFPHLFEDIEYLIPVEDEDVVMENAPPINAVAGPSRLS